MTNPWTPGPWSFYAPKSWFDGLGYIRPEPADGMEIAHHGDSRRSAMENEANARLIQHAPEMAEALEAINYELAALVGDPVNPDFSVALPNPADVECVAKAFAAARAILARIRGDAP
jgi:hypothetical protein